MYSIDARVTQEILAKRESNKTVQIKEVQLNIEGI